MALPDFTTDGPSTISIPYAQMALQWELIHDLIGGTAAMRAAGTQWLPREAKERKDVYDRRLARSFLYNGYCNAVERILSKPFSRKVTVEGEEALSPRLRAWLENLDMQGTGFTPFLRQAFEGAIHHGKVHAFVDFSMASGRESKAEEDRRGLRPFVHLVTAPQLISWLSTIGPAGQQILTDIRFRDIQVVKRGNFGTTRRHIIKRFTRTNWWVWEAMDDDSGVLDQPPDFFKSKEPWTDDLDWRLVGLGTHNFTDENGNPAIPLITGYLNKKGFLVSEPPMRDLAEMNLVHWQSFSDQRNILRFARLYQLFAKGMTEEEVREQGTVAVNSVWHAESSSADMKVLEHGGEAAKAGQEDIDRLEQRMEVLGNQPLIKRVADATATGVAVNEARTHTDAQAWITAMNEFGMDIIRMMALWARETPVADAVAVRIFNDFTATVLNDKTNAQIIDMRKARLITQRTFLNEAKRRSILDEALVVEDELEELENESQGALQEALDMIGGAEDDVAQG